MKYVATETSKHNKNLASVCGLFCGSCAVYYSTQENNIEKLSEIANRMGMPVSEMRCNGCRSDQKSGYCRNCSFVKCADDKGIEFCGECDKFPCEELKNFQTKMPHRKHLWISQKRIQEVGWQQWLGEMVDYYSCQECNAINGAYDMKCRVCGHSPGNQFVIDYMQ